MSFLRSLSYSTLLLMDFYFFLVGCCFVTFYTRKAALEAQNALHNIKTMPGVSIYSYIYTLFKKNKVAQVECT